MRKATTRKFFKVLQGTKSFCGGKFDWKNYLPSAVPHGESELEWTSGDWTPTQVASAGNSGWHVYSESGLVEQMHKATGKSSTAWLVEGRGKESHFNYTTRMVVSYESVRLLRPMTQEELSGVWGKCHNFGTMNSAVEGLRPKEDEDSLRTQVRAFCVVTREEAKKGGDLALFLANKVLVPFEKYAAGGGYSRKDATRDLRPMLEGSTQRNRSVWNLARCLAGDAAEFLDEVEQAANSFFCGRSAQPFYSTDAIRRIFPSWPLETVAQTMLALPEKSRGGWVP